MCYFDEDYQPTPEPVDCRVCKGTGKDGLEDCENCKGVGHFPHDEEAEREWQADLKHDDI